ncbi:MAG TPA: hypothetical protein VI818_08265 [Candidatus Thermoplasmatota archaeon]|nr:hypothetical protein [Candidatus Thermoplasmatota archaeon]
MRNGPKTAAMGDAWDGRTQGSSTKRLVEAAERFLRARKDDALGLAPARLLPRRRAEAWLLFWCAARRVDDAFEAEGADLASWRSALRDRTTSNFAERCVDAFLGHPAIDDPARVRRLLQRGLNGLEGEERFRSPRPMIEYLALLEYKSVPAMQILDSLLFPGESTRLVDKHANLFAVSAQLGDDCRDVHADRARGRIFVTQEELRERPLAAYVRSAEFAAGRNAMCARFLAEADQVALRFAGAPNRRRAAALSGIWSHALRTGQVRPTRSPLRLPSPKRLRAA